MGGQQAKSRKLYDARKEIITTTKSEIEILSSLRDGEKEYDFKNAKIIKEGGQAIVIEIKS
jgi:hypothetical protein